MVKSHEALWDNCLKLIKDNVTEQHYKTWFQPIVFESFNENDGTVMVQVPSMYVYEYLEQYYVGLLTKVLNRCFNTKVNLRYRVVTDKTNNISQTVEAYDPPAVDVPASSARMNQSPTMLDAAVPQDLNPQLDMRRTFRNFIEGDSNKLPRTVGLSIAEHPGKTTFNPFFVYGPSGCGKTHLINAIGIKCKEMYPQKRVLYVSARLFQVQYTDAVRRNVVNDFINFYQSIDVLIVDDIQEWATATKTLDTFFHIFNHLFLNGKQIILASDRPPVDLEGMKERTILINGFSKAHAMTGWRLGYACAPKPILQQMLKIHQYGIMSSPTTAQFAAIEALRNGDEDIQMMVDEYNRRRRLMTDGFNKIGLTCYEPKGAFYTFPSIQSTGLSSEEFCERLLEAKHVAVVPGTAFGECGEGFIRASYCYSVEHINEAIRRIGEFLEEIKK